MLASFSPDRSLFVFVTNDSRLIFTNLYESHEAPKTVSEPEHLTRKYQCLTWGYTTSSLTLFLGCQDGSISHFNASSLTFSGTMKSKDKNPILSLTVDSQCKRLFTTNGDAIHEWDLSSLAVSQQLPTHGQVVSCLDLIDDVTLLLAGQNISLLSLTSKTISSTLSGHSSSIELVFAIPNTPYVLTSSSNRFVNLWNIQTNELMKVLHIDHKPIHLNATVHNNSLYCTVVSSRGSCSLFCLPTSSTSSSLPLSPLLNVAHSFEKGDIYASVCETGDEVGLVVGRYSSGFTMVDKVAVSDDSQTVTLPAINNDFSFTKNQRDSGSNSFIVDVGASVDDAMIDDRNRKQVKAIGDEHKEKPLSLKDRLLLLQTRRNNYQSKPSLSVANALKQAISTENRELLDKCLTSAGGMYIKPTIADLDSNQCVVLLKMLIAKVDQNPNSLHLVLNWIQTLLIVHAASLIANPSTKSVLQAVNSILSLSSSSFNSFVALKSKIDLAVSLASQSNGVADEVQLPLVEVDSREPEEEGDDVDFLDFDDDDLMEEILNMDE
ncbi:hypothetical protein P9112_013058 [Eukaryota sp. TZLM1-RC]